MDPPDRTHLENCGWWWKDGGAPSKLLGLESVEKRQKADRNCTAEVPSLEKSIISPAIIINTLLDRHCLTSGPYNLKMCIASKHVLRSSLIIRTF